MLTMFQSLYQVGGPVLVLIIAISTFTLALIVYKYWQFRSDKIGQLKFNDFIAQVVNVNLETGFTFLNGPVQGKKGEIEFDAGHVEIHERGNKIFISSGIKLIVPASLIQKIGEE